MEKRCRPLLPQQPLQPLLQQALGSAAACRRARNQAPLRQETQEACPRLLRGRETLPRGAPCLVRPVQPQAVRSAEVASAALCERQLLMEQSQSAH